MNHTARVIDDAGVTADDFTSLRHIYIYEAMLALYAEGQPVEFPTVLDRLRNTPNPVKKSTTVLDAVQEHELTRIANLLIDNFAGASVESVNVYAHVLQRDSQRRAWMNYGQQIAMLAAQEIDLDTIVDRAEQLLSGVSQGVTITDGVVSFADVIKEHMAQVEAWRNDGDTETIKTPFEKLNDLIHGYEPGDLVVWACEPSKGKSAVLWQSATHAVKVLKKRALFLPLEMVHKAMASRSVAQEVGINTVAQRAMDDMQWKDYVSWAGEASEAYQHLYLAPATVCTLTAIRQVIRRYVRKHKVEIVFIDYLQLVDDDAKNSQNQVQELENITKGLLHLAQELGISIVTAAQLNRKAYGVRPTLGALRGGGIEQAPDKIIFIWNEYGLEEYAQLPAEFDVPTTFIVAKNRNGALGDVPVVWRKEAIKFMSAELIPLN